MLDHASAAADVKALCFHCGLAVPDHDAPTAQVLGETRVFCSQGCRVVAQAIVAQGSEDFYRFRTATRTEKGAAQALAYTVYDHPEVQKTFVRDVGDNRAVSLILEGISCSACLWLNEKTLRELDGITEVRMDASSHQAHLRWDPARLKLSRILQAVADIGFTAHPFDATRRAQLMDEARRRSTERLLFAGILMMPVMAFQIAGYWIGLEADGTLPMFQQLGRWFVLPVVTVLMAYSGADFFVGAWRDLKNRRAGMDVPVVLGLTLGWLGSAFATLRGAGDVYFDTIVMFIFFLLAARAWELQGRLTAASSIDRMLKIIPREVTRLVNGQPQRVMVHDVAVGDVLRVLPGETVALDGRLIGAGSSFDEALLTGESTPVLRQAGEPVIAGSCNIDQPVEVQVTHTADASTLNDIRQMVSRGMDERPRFVQAAERVVPWFVGAVLVIGVLTAAVWALIDPSRVLPNLISVLIITCPCALALATPVALAIAAGRFSQFGVLPMRMSAIEPLSRATIFAFDKTGTLTEGRPDVVQIVADGLTEDRALALAAALEARSEHPVGRALCLAATRAGLGQVADGPVRNFPAEGVQGAVGGVTYRVGRPEFALRKGAIDGAALIGSMAEQDATTVIVLADETRALASFALSDKLRAGAAAAIAALQSDGKRVALLSGDAPGPVGRIATELGVTEALSGLKPQDKLAWVRARQAAGAQVVMLGDGINDAPVLNGADASISFGAATDLARQACDFVLLRNDFSAFAALRSLADSSRRIIAQNLVWAIAYNVIAVPAAALGYVPPWLAAIGMSTSSIIVVTNAMRLRRA
ncbi:MAG: heavy metal translocating P-type ATPase [Paracoccaceae bacterium]